MEKDKKFRWVRDEIKIDFPVPRFLQNTMNEAEELDLANNIEYTCVADTIDMICKECVVNGLLTEEQWDNVVARYPVV